MSLTVFYFFIITVFRQIITFPAWWYTQGLALLIIHLYRMQVIQLKNLAIFSWIRHLFTPMFHDYTFVGRILSFIFRIFIIGGKLVILIVSLGLRLVVVILYIFFPIFVIYALFGRF